jgi:hypothetical protein
MSKTKEVAIIVEQLVEDGAESTEAMLNALRDGEYLAKMGWTQEEVECAYDLLKQDRQISVRLPWDIAECLDSFCDQTELSKNRVIVLAVREFLQSEKAERIKEEL